jgi:type 1 glutamine amidotransferase
MTLKVTAACILCAVAAFADYVNLKELTTEEKTQIEQALPASAPVKPKKARKILVVHMTRRDGKPSGGHQSIMWANHFLTEVGKRTGAFEVTIQNDDAAFKADNLKKYDALIFNNTVGVLFHDPALRQNLLDFVKNGKGFVGFHAAGATFVQYPKYDQFPEFGVMLGGYEDGGHPWSPNDTTYIKVDDPKSPLTSMFNGPFEIHDEAFQFREPTMRDRMHVLLSIDSSKMVMGPTHRILKQRQQDMDFPVSWIKPYGKGRVFYTTMGHNPAAFTKPQILQHILAGIQFAIGDLKAAMSPSEKTKVSSR